jgi:hypothetical protein
MYVLSIYSCKQCILTHFLQLPFLDLQLCVQFHFLLKLFLASYFVFEGAYFSLKRSSLSVSFYHYIKILVSRRILVDTGLDKTLINRFKVCAGKRKRKRDVPFGTIHAMVPHLFVSDTIRGIGAIRQHKHDRIRNSGINHLQYAHGNDACFEFNKKHLYFFNGIGCRNADGIGSDFVFPNNFFDRLGKHALAFRIDMSMLEKFAFRHCCMNTRLFGKDALHITQ